MLAVWEFPAWDPVILELFGPIHLRWYGLSYILAFTCAYYLMKVLARARFWSADLDTIWDLITFSVFGTMLGGRVGYALFYDSSLLGLKFFRVWEGGLSFHGGLLGVIAGLYLFARKHRLRMWRVGDVCALAVTPGIFSVRMANFINGELYGRETTADTFGAMQFPTDPIALRQMGLIGENVSNRAREVGIQYAFGKVDWEHTAPYFGGDHAELIKSRLDWETAREVVPFRHPSQLYEGFGEGVLIGLLLWGCWFALRKRRMAPGRFSGLFLIGYGIVRFYIEDLRQPDAQFRDADDKVGTVLFDFTMGQVLCSAMIVAGLVLVFRRCQPDEPPAGVGDSNPTDESGETVEASA